MVLIQVQFDKQYPVYAFDTACFYTDEETALDHKLQELRANLSKAMESGITPPEKAALNAEIKQTKEALKQLIDQNIGLVRTVRKEAQRPSNIVQVFESTLIRNLQMVPDDLNECMIIVRVYYFGVAESIIKNGFYMDGEKYVFFSASAGQIRTKKFVAIQESRLNACMNALTCGLSVEEINEHGGVNINKYLAYLALCNSATQLWKDFDINRCIVIDDFETVVNGMVDFIDEKTYDITRKEMGVPITHTDGCGMILPILSKKNFMVRAPWIKGLLSPFDFYKFIREANKRDPSKDHAWITDIYGNKHHVIKERIQIIFTKSQFKMWKYYDSFDTYKKNFKKYRCTAGKTNIEPSIINKATINYQMLQTLTSMTDEELSNICAATNRALSRISSDRTTMLRVLGADSKNQNKGYFQKCLELYPEMLQDEHCKITLREMKRSMEVDARAGKLMIDGKYQFLIPDLYAACQYWFEGTDIPDGLLSGNEVWTRLYPNAEQLDVLRSPHLYKEHAVRPNTYKAKPLIKKWFNTNGIYTSTHDLISKILQFDNDGDKSLVVADSTIISVAERECDDVVPLYYPMAKAAAAQITPTALYDGMVAAWTNGNIGAISNQISRIWASNHPDTDAVKILCMENNFIIDYAKTLYQPTRPPKWDERIRNATNGKVPAFFKYAKGKFDHQVNPRGNGVVDRLFNTVQIYKFRFNSAAIGHFDYRMLMYDENIPYGEKEEKIVLEFRREASHMGTPNVSMYDDNNHYFWNVKEMRKKFLQYGSLQYITDVLVRGMFHEHHVSRKSAFFDCFGDQVYQNLLNNLPQKTRLCLRCGKRFIISDPHQNYCKDCEPLDKPREIKTAECVLCGAKFKTRNVESGSICPACKMIGREHTQCAGKKEHALNCVDCGAPLDAYVFGRPSTRCPHCQSIRNKRNIKKWKIKHRSNA